MRIIKLALISFLFIFLLITGISLFIPSHVRISRATEIDRPTYVVLEQIAQPANWKNWYPGTDSLDLLMIDGKPQGVISGADSRQQLQITSSNDSMVTAMNRGPGSKNGSTGWSIMKGAGDSTSSVQWYMDFHLRWYPWEKFASLIFDKQYGAQMELGLHTMKKMLENN